MYDATRRKSPTVSAHPLDCSPVLAPEGDASQGFAVPEHIIPNARHAIRYRDVGECPTVVERTSVYCLQPLAHYQARKGATTEERTIPNTGDRTWYRHTYKIVAVVERISLNARHCVSNLHRSHIANIWNAVVIQLTLYVEAAY